MPRLKKLDPQALLTPATQAKMVDFVEREAKELADLGIGILADALKRRLSQRRPRRGSSSSRQNGAGPVNAPAAPPASPYQTLGVGPEASDEEVEKAFRQRVMACHPDRGGDEDEFRRVLAAIKKIRVERKP